MVGLLLQRGLLLAVLCVALVLPCTTASVTGEGNVTKLKMELAELKATIATLQASISSNVPAAAPTFNASNTSTTGAPVPGTVQYLGAMTGWVRIWNAALFVNDLFGFRSLL